MHTLPPAHLVSRPPDIAGRLPLHGLTLSICLHGALIGWLLAGLLDDPPLLVPSPIAYSIELVGAGEAGPAGQGPVGSSATLSGSADTQPETTVSQPLSPPESVAEPLAEPVEEPVAEPVTAPAAASIAAPINEPIPEPVLEPVLEPVPAHTAESIPEAVTTAEAPPVPPAPVPEPLPEPVKTVAPKEIPPEQPAAKPPEPPKTAKSKPSSPPKHPTGKATATASATSQGTEGSQGRASGGTARTNTDAGSGEAPAVRFIAASGNPRPPYPDSARRMRREGRVVLRLSVSASGDVEAVEITQSSGFAALDQSATMTVRRWRFVPEKPGGRTTASVITIPIAFSLVDGD